MQFTLSQSQVEKLEKWREEVFKEAIEIQREKMSPEDFSLLTVDGEFPYYGAIGGGLTYSFIQTGLGVIATVKESITGKEIDLTNYNEW